MVNFYNIIDLFLLISIILLTKISYEKRIYIKIFEYFKIFIAITLSAKLSGFTAILLQEFLITKADTFDSAIDLQKRWQAWLDAQPNTGRRKGRKQ